MLNMDTTEQGQTPYFWHLELMKKTYSLMLERIENEIPLFLCVFPLTNLHDAIQKAVVLQIQPLLKSVLIISLSLFFFCLTWAFSNYYNSYNVFYNEYILL